MALLKNDINKPKAVINTRRADLRLYTADALRRIKAINAGTVILPKEATPDFMEAYSEITKNIGSEKYLGKNDKIVSINGISEFDCRNADSESLYEISGISALTHCNTDSPANIILSGVSVYESDNNISFSDVSGLSTAVNFKIENVVIFSKDGTINKQFIEDITDNTVVMCGKDLTLNFDIDRESLKSKSIYFIAGKDIICPKEIIGTVQTMATAGKEITEDD